MIKIFYGDDRQKTQNAIEKILGKDYEVIEAENLTRADLDSLFYGTSLFGEERKILVKNLNENKECWDLLPKYVDTSHQMVVWASALDKRSVSYKELAKDKTVEIKEFAIQKNVDRFLMYKVFDEAYAGRGERAVKMCEKVETTDDPYMVMGTLVSAAFKKLEMRSAKAPAALKILSKIDLAMKSSSIDGWLLIKVALLGIGKL